MRGMAIATELRSAAKRVARASARVGALCVLGALAVPAMAQSAAPPVKKHPSHATGRHAATSHSTEAQANAETKPTAPFDAVAENPVVSFEHGKLTVQANNADLSTILDRVSQVSGMKINGAAGNARVFGIYGPGTPSQVLTDLLDGVGYNFMMVGDNADGAPSELLLTAKSGAPTTATAAAVPPPSPSSESDDKDADQEPPGPGAIIHVPPSVAQQADESQTQQRVQQNLQRLQQMRDDMEKQQSQPQ